MHHLTIDLFRQSYLALKRDAAPRVDGVTWEAYGERIEERLADLHTRVHRGAYRAQPSRPKMIPKADGRERPLGIALLEDKIFQRAMAEVLNAIYKEDFLGSHTDSDLTEGSTMRSMLWHMRFIGLL